jgi:hypothetical protein
MLRVVSARAATAQLRPISASRPACRGGPGDETECPGTILPDRRNGLGIVSGVLRLYDERIILNLVSLFGPEQQEWCGTLLVGSCVAYLFASRMGGKFTETLVLCPLKQRC